MTQTNNEREALLKTQDFIERIIEHTTDEWAKTELREVFNFIEHSLEKKPISQNEQQEAVAWMIWWDDDKWLFTGDREDFDTATKNKFPITPLFTSPPKQAIPEGWKLVPIEDLQSLKDSICGNYYQGTAFEIATVEKLLNAAPTNTEI